MENSKNVSTPIINMNLDTDLNSGVAGVTRNLNRMTF